MMNRIILFLSLLFICVSTTYAQKLDVGVKAGADLHKLEGLSFKDQFAFGYHVGAFVRVGLGRKLSVQPEVQWSQVNVDTSDRFSDVYAFNNLSRVSLGYLRIPVLLDYKLLPKISIQAGPQFGVLVDHNLSLLQNGNDAFKKGDFALLGGLQVSLAKLRLYGRYAIGLSDINDIDNRDKWKNQTIQIGVGLAF